MAFDISTARPERSFDIGTAQQQQQQPSGGYPSEVDSPETAQQYMEAVESEPEQSQGGIGRDIGNAALEFIAGVNRGALSIADMPSDIANAVMELSGSDMRAPTFRGSELGQQATGGGFMPEGVGRQVMGMAGEFAAPGLPVQQFAKAKQAAGLAPRVTDEAMAAMEDAGKYAAGDVPFMPKTKMPALSKGTQQASKKASTQGVGDEAIHLINTASPATKKRMAGMVKILEKGRQDPRYFDRYRPWDIPGKSLEGRVTALNKIKQQGGKEVDKAATALAGKSVDYSPAVDEFVSELDKLGVQVMRGTDGVIRPIFEGSVFRSSPKPKKIINDIVKHLDTENPVDARQVHIAKKYIDELVTWGKGSTGNAGQVENVAKQLRKGLNKSLGDAFPDYRAANEKYSEALTVLENIGKASGVKVDINSPEYAAAAGTGLRRLLSNAQSKSLLSESIDGLEAVNSKYGANFDDDIRDLVSFAERLDGMFGSAAKTSIGGEMNKAVDRGIETVVGGRTMYGAAEDAAKAGYKMARGVNEENAIKALDKLIKEGLK